MSAPLAERYKEAAQTNIFTEQLGLKTEQGEKQPEDARVKGN
jgi:hypothetical protein